MIRKSDVRWWVLEVRKHPEAAESIIEELAKRLIELDIQNEGLRDEIIQLQRQSQAPIETEAAERLRRQVSTLQQQIRDTNTHTPSVVLLTDTFEACRIPVSRAVQLARDGHVIPQDQLSSRPRHMIYAQPGDQLILLTSTGRGIQLEATGLPQPGDSTGWTLPADFQPQDRERLISTTVTAASPRFWTVITRKGLVQQLIHTDFDRRLAQGAQLVESPLRNDPPLALVDGDEGDLLLVTRWGIAERVPHRTLIGPSSAAIEVGEDDQIAGALTVKADTEILIVTASGYVMRRGTGRIASRPRPGGEGKALIQAYDVLAVLPIKPRAHLLFLTYSGRLVLVSLADVPLVERLGKGTQIHDFTRDPAVSVVILPYMR